MQGSIEYLPNFETESLRTVQFGCMQFRRQSRGVERVRESASTCSSCCGEDCADPAQSVGFSQAGGRLPERMPWPFSRSESMALESGGPSRIEAHQGVSRVKECARLSVRTFMYRQAAQVVPFWARKLLFFISVLCVCLARLSGGCSAVSIDEMSSGGWVVLMKSLARGTPPRVLSPTKLP